mgnify:CR=1 FL=1
MVKSSVSSLKPATDSSLVRLESPANSFELGIRGAVKDLTEFDDFVEVADRFEEGLLVPATIGDGIYALPVSMPSSFLFRLSIRLARNWFTELVLVVSSATR